MNTSPRWPLLLVCSTWLLLLVGLPGSALAQPTILPVRLLVDFRPPLPANQPRATGRAAKEQQQPAAAFAALNRRHRATQVQGLNPASAAQPGAPAPYLIVLPAGTDAAAATRAYQRSGLFRSVEVDGTGHGAGVRAVRPNDALYGRQWALHNNGTFALSPARAGADLNMENAWAITPGDTTVTVAVIDSGCKLDHPEVAGRIWRNRREIAGNGLDDDANGYVDDVQGWNFVANTNNPTDDEGHGTNVTGIIGANGNNQLGYAGMNWHCKLMVCKGLDAQNNGYYSWWISGIYYAVANGARVINMSLIGASASPAMQTECVWLNPG